MCTISGLRGQEVNETEYCCVAQTGLEIATLGLENWHSTEEGLLDNHKSWSSDFSPRIISMWPELSDREDHWNLLAPSSGRDCLKVRGQCERASDACARCWDTWRHTNTLQVSKS